MDDVPVSNADISEWAKRRHDRYLQHMPKTGEPVLLVLKAHLLVEEMLGDLIDLRLPNPAALRSVDLSFYLKSRLARALVGDQHPNGVPYPSEVWAMIDALNELRNDLAHKLESSKLATKYKKFTDTIRPSHASGVSDPSLFEQLSYVLGYFSAFEEIVRTGRIDIPSLKAEGADDAPT